MKLGRRTSTVHIVLTQPSSKDPSQTQTTCVVGYITQSNITSESGVSLPTHWALSPPPAPLSSIAALRRNEDPHWSLLEHLRFPNFRKAGLHVKTYLPREGQVKKSIVDEWICFSQKGERFTQQSLGYVVDMFPQIVETGYSVAEIEGGLRQNPSPKRWENTNIETEKPSMVKKHQAASFWYPTILLNLDVKKALPEEGVEFLFVRVKSRQIRNGRLDLEVTVLDESGDLVATSTHVALVLSVERNLKKSGTVEQSKL